MKRMILAVLLVALCVPSFAQTFSTAGTGNPMPVADAQLSDGFYAPATPTITLTGTAPVLIGTMVGGTTWVTLKSADNAFNYGGSTITNGNAYMQVATGSQVTFSVSPTNPKPKIYVVGQGTGATVVRIICGK